MPKCPPLVGGDGEDGRAGPLAHLQGVLEGDRADRVLAVGDDDDRLAPLALLPEQLFLGHEVEGVVEGGAARRAEGLELLGEHVRIVGEVLDQGHARVEFEQQGLVLGPDHLEEEFGGGFLLELQLVGDRRAGVDQEGDGQRQFGSGREILDLLGDVVLVQDEVVLVQVGDVLAFLVHHGAEKLDHLDADGDLALRGGRRFLPRQLRQPGQAGQDQRPPDTDRAA